MIATTFDHRCRALPASGCGRHGGSGGLCPDGVWRTEGRVALHGVRVSSWTSRAQVASIDPADLSTTTAGDATEIAEDYLAGVRRLEQAADGRYGTQLDALETAVNDVLFTLESVQDDADFSTWGPLIEDDLELAEDAAVQVDNDDRAFVRN